MKLYHTQKGIYLEKANQFFRLENQEWGDLINNDQLYQTLEKWIPQATPADQPGDDTILSPLGNRQELWACGVTYLRSKVGRQEESQASGGADFYSKVYDAERPEVFFKANPHRVSGQKGFVRIRKDSTWDVPEPELTLVVTASGKIIGYTIGNDMSSRSIEGENPLYLPQAKTYDGCAALGPCIYVTDDPLHPDSIIELVINRNQQSVFREKVAISQMKRTPQELVSFVYRACSFPYGCMIMTGTGIVPLSDFTLYSGDEIIIHFEPVGTLINTVK
ncbi:MAG: 2-hydroxyhepta-2,4-diene-1,7-dioate isomerase [Terrimonas sp.]|nr:2-hydroxyhepta-2,4-diene-1,7-dioate isomerase [Terrimonas sp.]